MQSARNRRHTWRDAFGLAEAWSRPRQREPLQRAIALVLVFACMFVAACEQSSHAPHSHPPTRVVANPTPASADDVITTVLENMRQFGYDNNRGINNGLGGLWVNWRYDSDPLQANLDGLGQADGPDVSPPRHDRLTDLRYLHILWMYKSLHPSDTRFDSEITRYTAIVKAEFTPATDKRGWVYDEFYDLYRLSQDAFFKQASDQLATYFDTSLYHADIGAIYEVSSAFPHGSYRVDLALEAGCALIEAGVQDGNTKWMADGANAVQFVYAHALVPSYHALVFQMTDVLLPDGSVNPDESIYTGVSGHTTIHGGQVKMGETAQEVLSLLHVYMLTHDHNYLDNATTLLDPLTAQANTFGLWDAEHLGYYAGIDFAGGDIQHAGKPVLSDKTKESGRQIQMLEAFRVANAVTGNRYQEMQALMERVAAQKAYYAPGHGYLYDETVDWKPVTLKNGATEDWVTSEAMGIALEGLLSVNESNPW